MFLDRGNCKSCGAKIRFIKTKTGKWMPVNADPISYKSDSDGKDKIVTPEGEVVTCKSRVRLEEATGVGYISHFATCPNSAMHRRNKKW